MNFYASREFLDAAASVYFKGRQTAIENVRIGDDVLRLLVVDGSRIVTRLQFLDVHQPLDPSEIEGPLRPGRYARNVVRGVIAKDEWLPDAFPRMELAPFIDWTAFPGFDDYRERLLQRHRGLVRDRERRWRSLAAAQGELVFTANDAADDVLATARGWKSRQLCDTGHPNYFARPETAEFLHLLREKKLLVSSTLRAGGRLISVWIGFIYQGCWSGWIFAYDPALKKYSPGHRLLWNMLEQSCRLGHREFDFSEGGEDYKMMYATHGRLLGEIGRPPLARSATVLAKSVLAKASPALLRTVQRLKKQATLLARPSAGRKARAALAPHTGS